MTNPNDPAFPILLNPKDTFSLTGGLTKREYFAAMAMQAYITTDTYFDNTVKQITEWALENADAIIAELNKAP